MNCPHCDKEIPDTLISSHWASEAGKKSKRKISPEAQRKMQEGKRAKKLLDKEFNESESSGIPS